MYDKVTHTHVHIHGDPVMVRQLMRIAEALEALVAQGETEEATAARIKALTARLSQSTDKVEDAVGKTAP
jgi:uncharacterized protein YigA (DUF484 family)